MTKDMETSAALLIEADRYENAQDYLLGPRQIASKSGFIAGAEWQKAQFDANREEHLLARDQDTIVSQSQQITKMLEDERSYKLQIKNLVDRLVEPLHVIHAREPMTSMECKLRDEIVELKHKITMLEATRPMVEAACGIGGMYVWGKPAGDDPDKWFDKPKQPDDTAEPTGGFTAQASDQQPSVWDMKLVDVIRFFRENGLQVAISAS